MQTIESNGILYLLAPILDEIHETANALQSFSADSIVRASSSRLTLVDPNYLMAHERRDKFPPMEMSGHADITDALEAWLGVDTEELTIVGTASFKALKHPTLERLNLLGGYTKSLDCPELRQLRVYYAQNNHGTDVSVLDTLKTMIGDVDHCLSHVSCSFELLDEASIAILDRCLMDLREAGVKLE